MILACSRTFTVRIYFDGGINHEKDENVKHSVGAGWILQMAGKIDHQMHLQWKTVVEVARVLDDERTITTTSEAERQPRLLWLFVAWQDTARLSSISVED